MAFEKNIGFLIAVIERVRRAVPEILFVVAGEGPAVAPLQHQVAQSGLAENVRFVGYLDRDGPLLDCYKCADVFVFASRTETQGLGVEAMAPCAVVSTAVMGTKTVLQGARGAMVVEENEAEFASAVVKVLTDREFRTSLATQAAEFVEAQWSSAEMAHRMHELYEWVLSRAPVSASERRPGAPRLSYRSPDHGQLPIGP